MYAGKCDVKCFKTLPFLFYMLLNVQDAHREIRKLANFLQYDLSDDTISSIVHMTSLDVMRKATSKNQGHQEKHESLFKKGKHGFLRKGDDAM